MSALSRPRIILLSMAAAVLAAGGYAYSGGTVPAPLAGIAASIGLGSKTPPATGAAAAPQNAGQAAPRTAPAAAGNAPPTPGSRPPVSVTVAKAERKAVPVRIDAIGNVQTIASVTLRSRVDSQIIEVAFEDGARVKKGDVLFRLDSRQIDAQVAQAEANIAKDRAALVSAEADFKRTDLLTKRGFGTDKVMDTATATMAGLQASIRAGEAQAENLRVQRSYYTIMAPISGRIGVAGLKVGNIARTGDSSTLLGVINQIGPIYVSFAIPQRYLPEMKAAITNGTAKALATPQGYADGVEGTVAVIDNSVDAQTGTITVRASFDNTTELLWPGALCQVRLTLRTEPNALVVPREAIQSGQNGSFVFEIVDGVAKARPVKVDRIVDAVAVLASGLNGGETIVIDGQQLLADGSRVNVRTPNAPAGTSRPAPAAGTPPNPAARGSSG
jgi:membrane fusion protein, multidrug efflux system